MPGNTAPQLAAREVGAALRKLRQAGEYTQTVIATRVLRVKGQETVSRIETGFRLATREELDKLLDFYQADAHTRGRIEGMWEQARNIGGHWYDEARFRDVFREGMTYFGYEDAAKKVRAFEGTYLPGPCQLRPYLEAIAEFGRPDDSEEMRETFLAARTLRCETFTREQDAPEYDAMFLETALLADVGGHDAMREQLQHLLTMTELDNVHLRVIPYTAGAAAVHSYPFTLFDFHSETLRSVAAQSLPQSVVFTDQPQEYRDLQQRWALLEQYALSEEETRNLIKKVL